jgi:hypothetical protein
MKAITRRAAREEWIKRYTAYFGEPMRLQDYRAKEISFGTLYRSAKKTAEDMVTEASRCDFEAFSSRDER